MYVKVLASKKKGGKVPVPVAPVVSKPESKSSVIISSDIDEGTLKLLEAEEARWLTKDTLYDVQWLPANNYIDR